MTDATESLAAVCDSCERCAGYADADLMQIAFAHVRAILAHIDAQSAEIAALRTERDSLKADAERYRWLRGDSCPDHSSRWTQWEVRCWKAPFWTNDLRHSDLDYAIDAARSKGQK